MKISTELSTGIKSLVSLFKVIELILNNHNIPIKYRGGALNWYGFYIGNQNKDFYIGLYFDDPENIKIESHETMVQSRFKNNNDPILIGIIENNYWHNKLNITEGDIYFAELEEFIVSNIKYLKSISDPVTW